MSMTPELNAIVSPILVRHEGRLLHMYGDTNKPPVVTVGVGHALFTKEMAKACEFWRTNTVKATSEDIEAVWTSIRQGLRRPLALIMTYEETERLFAIDKTHAELGVHDGLGDFDYRNVYGLYRQAALIDLSFNSGTLKKWPKLCAAIKAGDYITAAKESNRPALDKLNAGPSPRNLETYNMLCYNQLERS